MTTHSYIENHEIINWAEFPMIRLLVGLMAGITAGLYLLDKSFILYFSIVLLSLSILLLFGIRLKNSTGLKVDSISMLCICFSVGILLMSINDPRNHSTYFGHHINTDKSFDTLLVVIDKRIKLSKVGSTIGQVKAINGTQSKGKVLLYFEMHDSINLIQKGNELIVISKINPTTFNNNPKAFNYGNYLAHQGIFHQGFVKQGFYKLTNRSEFNFLNWTDEIRDWGIQSFESLIKQKDFAHTAIAIVLGYKDNISDDLYSAFSETGAVHVLAVSGLHVGIICWIFLWVLNFWSTRWRYEKVVKYVILLLVVWSYAMISGAAPAVLRASVMFSFLLAGKYWFKSVSIYNILATSAFLLLVYDPHLLFLASFQFSYLALLSILFFQPRIYRLFTPGTESLRNLWKLASVSFAAQILILPVTLYYFNKVPTYFLISGVFSVWLAPFILSGGILLLMIQYVPFIGLIYNRCYEFLLSIFVNGIYIIRELPMHNISGIFLPYYKIVLVYALIAGIMYSIMAYEKNYLPNVGQFKIRLKGTVFCISILCLLLITDIYESYRVLTNEHLIIYDVKGYTIIDIYSHGNRQSIESPTIPKKTKSFSVETYRNSMKASEVEDFLNQNIEADKRTSTSIFKFKGSYFYLIGLGINQQVDTVDYLIVSHQTETKPWNIKNLSIAKTVIIDNSIDYFTSNAWKKYCREKEINCHEVRKDGVFIFKK